MYSPGADAIVGGALMAYGPGDEPTPDVIAASISALMIRPLGPVPVTLLTSIPLVLARL